MHHIPWHLAWQPTFFANEYTSEFPIIVRSNASFHYFHRKPVIVKRPEEFLQTSQKQSNLSEKNSETMLIPLGI